jgi:hypothetical protein
VCDFESTDRCGFTDDLSAKFSWTHHKGSTPTDLTGPDFDHTTFTKQGNQNYVDQ